MTLPHVLTGSSRRHRLQSTLPEELEKVVVGVPDGPDFHFDASTYPGLGYVDGDEVDVLDSSGNDRNLTQPGLTDKPLFRPASGPGHDSVELIGPADSRRDIMTPDYCFPAGCSAVSMVLVAKFEDSTESELTCQLAEEMGAYHQLYMTDGGFRTQAALNFSTGWQRYSTVPISMGEEWFILAGSMPVAASKAILTKNGADMLSSLILDASVNITPTTTGAQLSIGATNAQSVKSWLAECLVYQRALSAAEVQGVTLYLAEKYSITLEG